MTITAIIVDDESFDRMSARRRLSRQPAFGEVLEADDGDVFLDRFYGAEGDQGIAAGPDSPALILMDINMRRLDGFEALEQLGERIARGFGQPHVVAAILTSSGNDRDIARAGTLPIIRGFFVKPLSDDDTRRLAALCGGPAAH